MNYKLMLRTLGRTLQLEALCLLPPLVTALLYHEDPRPFVYTIVLVALLGTALSCLKAKPEFFYLKTDKEDYPPKLSNIRF